MIGRQINFHPVFSAVCPSNKLGLRLLFIANDLTISTLEAETFHQTMKPLLITAQSFGIIPVNGITGDDPKTEIHFSWCSYKVFYNVFCLIGCFSLGVLVIIRLSKQTFQFSTVSKYTPPNLTISQKRNLTFL